jgi:WD repeat-containing protein 68
MYGPPASSAGLPGSLQPGAGGGAGGRPTSQQQPSPYAGSSSSNNPPLVPHINTNAQQYTLPTRSSAMSQQLQLQQQLQAVSPGGQHPHHAHSHSHSYSRSSPPGLQDQKYIPFSSGAGGGSPADLAAAGMGKYPQTPQQKFFSPQTPTGGSNSPLVLEQIRPRANSSLMDDQLAYGEVQAGTSNYMAPWAVFAFDWCKYPATGSSSAGKLAIGSYLEDPHNFVRPPTARE